MKLSKLPKDEQSYWLKQHIRTRVCAALASRRWLRHFQSQYPVGSQEHASLECIFHATWEGQHSAVRWLIEFVGVERSKDSDAVDISQFEGGILLTKGNNNYTELKNIWVGLSKATSHPTRGKHSDISETRLYNAAKAIVTHLNQTIYPGSGVNL